MKISKKEQNRLRRAARVREFGLPGKGRNRTFIDKKKEANRLACRGNQEI